MKIIGFVNYGDEYNGVTIEVESVEEYKKVVKELVEAAPGHFEAITQIKQAALAAEILGKPEVKSAPVERTKSSPPPNNSKVADKNGCRHGKYTEFEEGKYKHTKYCAGPKDDVCTFAELKAAGIR